MAPMAGYAAIGDELVGHSDDVLAGELVPIALSSVCVKQRLGICHAKARVAPSRNDDGRVRAGEGLAVDRTRTSLCAGTTTPSSSCPTAMALDVVLATLPDSVRRAGVAATGWVQGASLRATASRPGPR